MLSPNILIFYLACANRSDVLNVAIINLCRQLRTFLSPPRSFIHVFLQGVIVATFFDPFFLNTFLVHVFESFFLTRFCSTGIKEDKHL